jgi:hypothetical protein
MGIASRRKARKQQQRGQRDDVSLASESATVPSRPSSEKALVEPIKFGSAIDTEKVALGHLYDAYTSLDGSEPKSAKAAADYLPKLLRSYQRRVGRIHDLHYIERYRAAVAFTSYPYVDFLSDPTIPPRFAQVLWGCFTQARQAEDVLHGRSREIAMRQLYGLMAYLLDALDSPTETSDNAESINRAFSQATRELSDRQRALEQLAEQLDQRSDQGAYLLGMVPSIALLIGLVWSASRLRIGTFDVDALRLTLMAGGIGAAISVMARTTRAQFSQSLDIDAQAGRLLIGVAGFFRPLIGAILGLAFYFIVNAGLIPIKVPNDSATAMYFFASIAFLAGFTERLAQDALVQTANSTFIPASQKDKPGVKRVSGRSISRKQIIATELMPDRKDDVAKP